MKYFLYFAGLIVTFIASAVLLGDYYSALAALVAYIAGVLVEKGINTWL